MAWGSYSTTGATGRAIGTQRFLVIQTHFIAYKAQQKTRYAAGFPRAYNGGKYARLVISLTIRIGTTNVSNQVNDAVNTAASMQTAVVVF
jgi:hypothetical protein